MNTYHTMKLLGFIPKEPIPAEIQELAKLHEIGFEYFICARHRQWFVDIDIHFPYMRDWCYCEQCKNGITILTEVDKLLRDIEYKADDLRRALK